MTIGCSKNLCEIIADIVGKEFNAPNFTASGKGPNFEKARYFYVYICRVHADASFQTIRQTMPIYTYSKTVHQVFRRMYERKRQDKEKFSRDLLDLMYYIKQPMSKN